MGYIKLIIGPMFSGKTWTLINDVERHSIAGRKCVIIRHTIDTRYDKDLTAEHGIICNNGVERAVTSVIKTNSLTTVDVSSFDVIGVMESQFFEDLLKADEWATAGKIVICDGLDGDCLRANFGRIAELIPKCEEIIKLRAVCACGADAAFTKKKATPSGSVIDVGGKDKYLPVCRTCYTS